MKQICVLQKRIEIEESTESHYVSLLTTKRIFFYVRKLNFQIRRRSQGGLERCNGPSCGNNTLQDCRFESLFIDITFDLLHILRYPWLTIRATI